MEIFHCPRDLTANFESNLRESVWCHVERYLLNSVQAMLTKKEGCGQILGPSTKNCTDWNYFLSNDGNTQQFIECCLKCEAMLTLPTSWSAVTLLLPAKIKFMLSRHLIVKTETRWVGCLASTRQFGITRLECGHVNLASLQNKPSSAHQASELPSLDMEVISWSKARHINSCSEYGWTMSHGMLKSDGSSFRWWRHMARTNCAIVI